MFYRPVNENEYPDLPTEFALAAEHLPMRRQSRWWREILQLLVMGALIYILVNVGTARASIIGPSMRPNFETGQVVIVNRLAYVFGEPQRGDVVVVENPADRCRQVNAERPVIPLPFMNNNNTAANDCDDLFKRIIGLPGENVAARGGQIYINGKKLDEPYIKNLATYDGKWTLSATQYFVLGDNRPHSYDSHNFGPIERSLIFGKAWIRYWPLNEIEVIPGQEYRAR
jgi:signal peptidase I